MTQPIIRRGATSVGIVIAVVLGIAAVRAAAQWTAAATDLEQPISTAAIEDQLAAERARSAALSTQLHDLVARSRELEEALAAAESRIADDADVASGLTSQLAAARDRLATLEASIQAANARLAGSSRSGGGSTAVPALGSHVEHEDHEDHEDHEGESDD